MKLKMRFLAPPISLACLLFGLCFADAAETQVVLRAPQKVELPQAVSTEGTAQLVAYTDFMNTCEGFGPYQVQVKGSTIVVNSYITLPQKGDCAQEIFPENAKTYRLKTLARNRNYQVYFRNFDGQAVYVGRLQPSR